MKLFRFDEAVGRKIEAYQSDFILSKMAAGRQMDIHVGCMYLNKNGIVGLHQAPCPQLLFIVQGEGWVRGDSEQKVRVASGEAVFWEEGEWHETWTEQGLVAIVIESPQLQAPDFLQPVK